MKKKLLLLLLTLLPMVAMADAVEIDGIYYNLITKGKVAEVTYGNWNPTYPYQDGDGRYAGTVVIPQSVTYEDVSYSVTSIWVAAFYNCQGLTSVSIPNSVTSIGDYAFESCTNLTSITIGNSVTSIGESAFYGCSSLTSVHISDIAAWCNIKFKLYESNPLYYAHHLYMNGEEVKDLVIPNSVSSIGNYAFKDCIGLTSIIIPNSVTSIGESAFQNCTGLTSVHISDIAAWCNIKFRSYDSNPLFYAQHLYMNGEEVKDLVIPNSVTSIGERAFYGCTGLTSITIPNSVTSIDGSAFDHCTGLTSIIIPNSVTSIGVSAFRGCSSLTSVTIPNNVTSIGESAFGNCSGLTSVHISDIAAWCNIKFGYFDSNPLYYAHHLYMNGEEVKDLVIPNSVTSIGYYAFSNCSGLTSITIGNGIKTIGDKAFAACPELTDVYCYAEMK